MSLEVKVRELEQQVALLKVDQRVTSESSHWHILRCRMVEDANTRANQMIGELSNQLAEAYAQIAKLDENQNSSAQKAGAEASRKA